MHETGQGLVQTAPFGARTDSLNEKSQTIRTPQYNRLTGAKIEVDYLLAHNLPR
jgi:hypothetical protein